MHSDPVLAPAVAGAVPLALGPLRLEALPSGALWWPARQLLTLGDLHLGRADRMARRGGTLLPPYETEDTLARVEAEVARLRPRTLILLGDSFDDARAAEHLAGLLSGRLLGLATQLRLVWVPGNHDPGPVALPGDWMREVAEGPLRFRHIAAPLAEGEVEVSAHYHPRADLFRMGRRIRRRCFLADGRRVILPAFGTYTGGLDACAPCFDRLLDAGAVAYLTGSRVTPVARARLG